MDELLIRLFSYYGLVYASKIAKEEQKVDIMVWNLNDPVVIFYRSVKEFLDLAAAGNDPKIQDQIVTIDVEMIKKTQYFETGLRKWFERPAVKYTCGTGA